MHQESISVKISKLCEGLYITEEDTKLPTNNVEQYLNNVPIND